MRAHYSPFTRCLIITAAALLPVTPTVAAGPPAELVLHSNQDRHVLHSNQDRGTPASGSSLVDLLTSTGAWLDLSPSTPAAWPSILGGPGQMAVAPPPDITAPVPNIVSHGNSPGPQTRIAPHGDPVGAPAGWLIGAGAVLLTRRRRRRSS